jgi:RNA polymerase sigma-54 factor
MAIGPRLELRHSQTLVMTPQLQQAIKLLQFSNLELREYVETELERNPLLERADGEGAEGGEGGGEEPVAVAEPQGEPMSLDSDGAPAAAAEAIDIDYENVFNNDSAADAPASEGLGDAFYPERGGRGGFDEDLPGLEGTLASPPTLKEHLTEQLQVTFTDPADRLLAAVLIDGLDEAGYLTIDLAELAARVAIDLARIEALVRRLQGFDPTGVFARDLKECLALQLKERNRLDPAMATLLDNLPLVARKDIHALVRLCGVDAEDVADMIAELRALNPKPGNAFETDVVQTLVPDVFVRRATDGSWNVELNSDTLPRLLVNTRYHARVLSQTRGKTDKVFLSDCLASANWLIRSLDQRANTILKVAAELVKRQEGFLQHGVKHLKPLNLRTIAEAIEMHESTVSRVTSNKYMATPRGIYEMKYFFTASLGSTDGGDSHSAEAVRARIRELIDAETADDILSDDKICELLKAEGIDIARRTVAKYREAMRIGSSAERRRAKRLEKQK